MSRRHSVLATTAVATLLFATLASSVIAQGREPLRQPASVPLELAAVLTSAGGFAGMNDPQILVGELPEWVAARLYVPANARVLGSAFLGTTLVGVISIPTVSDTLLAHLQREHVRRGWSAPPTQPYMSGGGFRPAPSAPSEAAARRFTLCGDRQILNATIARERATETVVVLRLSATPRAGVCNPPVMRNSRSQRSEFPTLYNPAGSDDMRAMMQCSSSMGALSSGSTGTRLRTAMSPESVLDHYDRQLRDSGWVSPRTTPSVVGRTWMRADSSARPDRLSIFISSSTRDTTCRSVELRLENSSEP